jgi:hypothetical protein|tara:strand:+ start:1569 stop:1979 length:411 start_codon:yes stop_codon:yes gene_type:complete
MTWQDILKQKGLGDERIVKERTLEQLIEEWGYNKDDYDYLEMENVGFNSAVGLINLDIELDRSLADDEGIDDDADPADLIRDDLAHFRIEFSTPSGKTIALCDYTDYAGYTPLIESNIENLTDEELDKAIKGMEEV